MQLINAVALPGNKERDFALYRMPQAYLGRAMHLCMDSLQEGEGVFVLQYTEGASKLKIAAGHLLRLGELVQYSADTNLGASGAPVINAKGQVLCMHLGSIYSDNEGQWVNTGTRSNHGVSLESLFTQLKTYKDEWFEIANYHQLAMLTIQEAVLPAAELESVPSMPPRGVKKVFNP
ncbi:serine protease [Paraflavitalea speifideaquila]|uniref:S1 family peptidase n=1 Tax=Paraflavitalea speifideaquila TaxID=3076558 RepID=UPI0028F00D70|nr:serine protease [Paraflavitalea speifideiaquila]